jgi:hypothetical protein
MLLAFILLLGATAHAMESQLAGMRINQHAVDLLDKYGTPDGIVTGEGEEVAAAAGAGGAAAGMGPGMGGGMPGMGGGGMPGMGGGGMPGMGGGGMPGMGGGGMPGMGGGGMPGMGGGGMPGMMGGGGAPGGGGGMPGMGGSGAPGGAGGAAGGGAAAGGAVSASAFPTWGMPVWVTLGPSEVEWLYRRYGVVLGFVLDRDGYITVIAIAAEDCNYARTAKWAPHKYIKLGDDFRQVVYRYGYPDATVTYDATGTGEVASGGGSITFSAQGISRVFSRDCVLRYTESNNITFTLHNMTVIRIHIWKK